MPGVDRKTCNEPQFTCHSFQPVQVALHEFQFIDWVPLSSPDWIQKCFLVFTKFIIRRNSKSESIVKGRPTQWIQVSLSEINKRQATKNTFQLYFGFNCTIIQMSTPLFYRPKIVFISSNLQKGLLEFRLWTGEDFTGELCSSEVLNRSTSEHFRSIGSYEVGSGVEQMSRRDLDNRH